MIKNAKSAKKIAFKTIKKNPEFITIMNDIEIVAKRGQLKIIYSDLGSVDISIVLALESLGFIVNFFGLNINNDNKCRINYIKWE